MPRLTFEAEHAINDVVFVLRDDGSVMQGCVYSIISRCGSNWAVVEYEVQHERHLSRYAQKCVFSDPSYAFNYVPEPTEN